MRKWFRRGCVITLVTTIASLPLLTASLASAAVLGPGIYDQRRGGQYGLGAVIDSGCDVSPPQDLELEWNGTPMSWESVEVSPAPGGKWNLIGFYRVPSNTMLGYQPGPEVFCWDAGHTTRTSALSFSPGGVVAYDGSVSPTQTAAGAPATVEGFTLPGHCGGGGDWATRISLRFDSLPRPWTSITGSIDGMNRVTVSMDAITPDSAALGPHEWSIWCQNYAPPGDPVTYSALWERTVEVVAPAAAAVSASATVNPSAGTSTQSPSAATTSAPGTSAAVIPAATATMPAGAASGWPRTNVIKGIPRSQDLSFTRGFPWLMGGLLLLAILLFLLIGFPSELFNKTFEENEPAIRRWLRLRPKRDWALHPVRWPIILAVVVGGAALMALAEPSPLFSRETLITMLALIVAVPVTALVYEFVLERHARKRGGTHSRGKLKPVYPAIAVAVLCAVLSRVLHFVPGYVYGLIIAYTAVSARRMSPRQEATGVLKAIGVLMLTAMLSWGAWQIWFADPASAPGGFLMRWLDTILGYVALIGLEAPLLGLLPLRFMDGKLLWQWSKPLWLTTYSMCLAGFLIVLMDFGATTADWSEVIMMAILFLSFGLGSFTFWAVFALRTRRLSLNQR